MGGSYPAFTDWNVGQPDNYAGNENCLQIIVETHHSGTYHSTLGKWNDQQCQKKYDYMCEIKSPISEYQTFSYLEGESHNGKIGQGLPPEQVYMLLERLEERLILFKNIVAGSQLSAVLNNSEVCSYIRQK